MCGEAKEGAVQTIVQCGASSWIHIGVGAMGERIDLADNRKPDRVQDVGCVRPHRGRMRRSISASKADSDEEALGNQ